MSPAPRGDYEWCPLKAALRLLERPWTLATIRELLDGPRHFGELREATQCPSPSTVTRRLRVLEKEGIVHREVLSAMPPSVRYELTVKGEALGKVLHELNYWAEEWLVPPDEATPVHVAEDGSGGN